VTAFGWKGEQSVAEWLFAEPWRFDFFQAVRLLEALRPGALSPGHGAEPEKEAVRFRSRVGLDFPASEVQQIVPSPEPGASPEMTVNFMGLAGAFGPLSPPDTELVLDRIRSKDFASRDFLDIFNHRLVSLMYQVRKLHRLALTTEAPERSRAARYLYAFFGLGLPQLHNRMRVDDRALLYTAGILSQHPRSAAGLEQLLSHHFGVPTAVRQLVGRWRALDPRDWTRIGRKRGRNQRLGEGVVLGTKMWDQQGSLVVQLGPLRETEFRDFLPTGTGYHSLCELTRFYVGQEFDFAFRLVLQAPDIPATRLGQSRLGWTSWLKSRPSQSDDSQVCLRPQ